MSVLSIMKKDSHKIICIKVYRLKKSVRLDFMRVLFKDLKSKINALLIKAASKALHI